MGLARFAVVDEAMDEDTASIWPLYQSVFGDHPTMESWLGAVWDRHRVRDGFRLALAYDGDALVGFASSDVVISSRRSCARPAVMDQVPARGP
jgi:hypothetical protein